MSNKQNIIFHGIDRLARGLGFLGQLALASMVLTICYDVIMRYVFRQPTLWSLEINTFLVLFLALIPAGDALLGNSHLRITFFVDKMGRNARKAFNLLGCLAGCLFSSVMVWKGLDMALSALKYDERMSTPLGTPMVIPYMFLPIGFGVLFLEYAIDIFRNGEKTEEIVRPKGD